MGIETLSKAKNLTHKFRTLTRSLEPVDDEVVPIPVPPPPHRGGWGHYEGTDDSLHNPVEILQVNPDEDSLPVSLQRSRALDEEGRIIPANPPDYEDPPYA